MIGLLQSLLPLREPDVPMDDNAALTDMSGNPFLSPAITTMRSGFDSLYEAVEYFIEGKRTAIKQADRSLKKWEAKLQWIADQYQKLLDRFDEAAGDLVGGLSSDVAIEAWETLRDSPIFRRYLGEANYWLLYDTVGLAAYQPQAVGGSLAESAKQAAKAGIKALLDMTDGAMAVESYLELIAQWWGALYIKSIPHPLLASVVPNVTCAYYYKPAAPSLDGIRNPAPDLDAFIAVPTPIFSAQALGSRVDRNDPSTWESPSGEPRCLNQEALLAALEYWGSSYTDAEIPLIVSSRSSAAYQRRDYVRDPSVGPEAHPLQVGQAFAQLDTTMTKVAYSGTSAGQDEAALAEFEKLWEAPGFQATLRDWAAKWEAARDYVVTTLKDALRMKAPRLDANGDPVAGAWAEFTSMRQILPGTVDPGNARSVAFDAYMHALFQYDSDGALVKFDDGSPYFNEQLYQHYSDMYAATLEVLKQYLLARGQDDGSDPVPTRRYLLGRSRELSILLTRAAAAMRAKVPASSRYQDVNGIVPLLAKSWDLGEGRRLNYHQGLSYFARMLPASAFPAADQEANAENKWPEGLRYYRFKGSSWSTPSDEVDWVAFPAWGSEEVGAASAPAYFSTYMMFLVYPALQHAMPFSTYMFADGRVAGAEVPATGDDFIGLRAEGALTDPRAWLCPVSSPTAYPTCGFFVGEDIDQAPTTVVGALVDMMDARASISSSLEEEIAEEVGYSVLKGVQPLAACFDAYGRLLKMAPWCFQAMPSAGLPPSSPTYDAASAAEETFASKYARIEKGSDLWYDTKDPSHVVYRHSGFYSPSSGKPYTIYHEAMARHSYSRGSLTCTFCVFPTESVSIYENEDHTWHYITMRNAVPKCPKYVESGRWSFMDILNELYVLAQGIGPLCGDNGERLARLDGILSDLKVKGLGFVGQLPENDGQSVELAVGVFDDFADRIEKLVGSIYELKAKLLAATEAW